VDKKNRVARDIVFQLFVEEEDEDRVIQKHLSITLQFHKNARN